MLITILKKEIIKSVPKPRPCSLPMNRRQAEHFQYVKKQNLSPNTCHLATISPSLSQRKPSLANLIISIFLSNNEFPYASIKTLPP